MTPVRATIASEIGQKIDALYQAESRFIDECAPEFKEVLAEADKLGKIDGALRSTMLARLYGLTGDRNKAEYYLENAKCLHVDPVELDLANITFLLGLGYFSEAMPLIRKCGAPGNSVILQFLANPPTGAFFHLLLDFEKKAAMMNLMNVKKLPEVYPEAVSIMDYWGDSDEDYATALDCAGKVLRSHRLFLSRQGMVVATNAKPKDGSPPYVKIGFHVDVHLDMSIDMTCEYGALLARSGGKIPQSLVFEFISTEQ